MPWTQPSSDPKPFQDVRDAPNKDEVAFYTDLAAHVSAYLRALRECDVPLALAEQLVRDYQATLLQRQTLSLGTIVVSQIDPQTLAQMVRKELLKRAVI